MVIKDMGKSINECVQKKMHIIMHEPGNKLTQKQALGKAFGICRQKLGDFLENPYMQKIMNKLQSQYIRLVYK